MIGNSAAGPDGIDGYNASGMKTVTFTLGYSGGTNVPGLGGLDNPHVRPVPRAGDLGAHPLGNGRRAGGPRALARRSRPPAQA